MTKQTMNKLQTTQRTMEQQMLDVYLKRPKAKYMDKAKTKIKNIAEVLMDQKWDFAGPVARCLDYIEMDAIY